MKISPDLTSLKPDPPAARRLPGEPRPFKERSIRNLTPPQHLEGGAIVSGRSREVSRADPLLLRIKELEAEVARLRQELSTKEPRS